MLDDGQRSSRLGSKKLSLEPARSAYSSKQSRKPAPEMTIDFIQPSRKPKPLTLNFQTTKQYKEEPRTLLQPKSYRQDPFQITRFDNNLKMRSKYDLQRLQTQNQTLKAENSKLKTTLAAIEIQNKDIISLKNQQQSNFKEDKQALQMKLKQYSDKIKHLYEQLIEEKRKASFGTVQKGQRPIDKLQANPTSKQAYKSPKQSKHVTTKSMPTEWFSGNLAEQGQNGQALLDRRQSTDHSLRAVPETQIFFKMRQCREQGYRDYFRHKK